MSDHLRIRPWSTPAMMEAWADAAVISHALGFEAALAAAQAAEGVVDGAAASAIADACARLEPDPAALADEVAWAGTLAIPLVRRLREALPAAMADSVHRAATSQDLADTVLMLQVRAAGALLAEDLAVVTEALATLARRTATLPAVGRTLLQDAAPIGFGLRVAQWHAAIATAAAGLRDAIGSHAAIQLGGAAGTRAGMDGRGGAVAARLAAHLGLAEGPPWHARRGGLATIAAAIGILIGALGKAARDVALLAQGAVGEAREPLQPGRGGSSAMPHKRNPTGCQIALSAAARAPGLVATILAGLPAEQERGLGGWQAEAPVMAELFLLAAGAAAAMAGVARGLELDEAAISGNLETAGLGRDVGESAALVADLLREPR